MNYFTDLYFKTIDPSFTYVELLNMAVFYSIILHTVVYSIIVLIINRSFGVWAFPILIDIVIARKDIIDSSIR